MSPTRLIVVGLALFVSAAPSPAQPATHVINLYSFGYGPTPLRLRAGQPVTLTFVNRSGSGHDFTAPAFFAASRVLAGSAAAGEIELRPGQTRSITLVPRAGVYRAHCSHFMHTQLGMRDTIVVD